MAKNCCCCVKSSVVPFEAFTDLDYQVLRPCRFHIRTFYELFSSQYESEKQFISRPTFRPQYGFRSHCGSRLCGIFQAKILRLLNRLNDCNKTHPYPPTRISLRYRYRRMNEGLEKIFEAIETQRKQKGVYSYRQNRY